MKKSLLRSGGMQMKCSIGLIAAALVSGTMLGQ